jgi:acyl dehydratase
MGETELFFDDVTVGSAGPVRKQTLKRVDLVKYAGASQDFNPMHVDEVSAQAAGLPGVFGHGMFSAGLLASAITDYVGIGNLRRYKARFAKQTWPGDVMTTSIEVTAKRTEGSHHYVDLDCRLATDKGITVIIAEATAELPLRASNG